MRAFWKEHKRFYIAAAVILLLILLGVSLYCGVYAPFRRYAGRVKRLNAEEMRENEDFQIERRISSLDEDGDGVDNQTDMLESARSYLDTKPKYKSKYYDTGYPDDAYGVCTDVVAFAMLGSGFDLRKLVAEDIQAAPEAYAIEKADDKIDFRRVRNLKVFFKRHAIPLTTDPKEIAEWQGGDIVIFQNHIGIVSDKRNRQGVALVLHNATPYQKSYEEDILESWGEIVGHYRIE